MNKCLRCNYEWLPRIQERTRQCPNCKSPRWDTPLKTQANAIAAVKSAVKRGLLPKLNGNVPCIDCGQPATVYDHRDYADPLHVEPVCQSCNVKRGPAANIVNEPMRVRTIRLPDAHWQTLDAIGRIQDRSVSYVLRQIIDKYINEIKDNPEAKNNLQKSEDTP